jgi:AmmeMemoRadiSam system protein A
MALIALADRERLLELARQAVVARASRLPVPEPLEDIQVACAGVFVTIHCAGCLRGCLGTLDPIESLAAAIVRLAGDAATRDGRFTPICVSELESVTVDISVLLPPEPVVGPLDVVIGRHGVIVSNGRRSGLLLPQVAVEHEWSAEAFLAHACLKAGLADDAWRTGASVLRFEAEVFGGQRHGPDRSL